MRYKLPNVEKFPRDCSIFRRPACNECPTSIHSRARALWSQQLQLTPLQALSDNCSRSPLAENNSLHSLQPPIYWWRLTISLGPSQLLPSISWFPHLQRFLLRSSPLHRTSGYRMHSVDKEELDLTQPFLESRPHDDDDAHGNYAEDHMDGCGESPSSAEASSRATPWWVGPLLSLAIYTCFVVFVTVMVLRVRQDVIRIPRTLDCKSPLYQLSRPDIQSCPSASQQCG